MKRWPIIRHIRWWIESRRVDAWYRNWASVGLLLVHRERDEEVLRAIWRGER